ncbi:MAG: DUF692 domain-containing protein [Okeania sp. SIO3I5]|uniref:MNIO family bufferin maturase n=1 Tax=Okeania sp. SIO3I5 TaxID=2607805 RepID=UPI0013BA0F6A|nr:DUF692 domain-containing protein [Okeania sp. SIO3I5]NEQ38286.1 DUF692 domain-containing protein [Okeania sp. SIO3I5]
MTTDLQSKKLELEISYKWQTNQNIPYINSRSIQGAGIGLRSVHYQYILSQKPKVNWFEVLSDNYFCAGGLPIFHLEKIRQDYPVTLHGVGMSLGSTDPLNLDYLTRLKNLAAKVEPDLISEHLSWISVNNHYLNDLIPLVYTEEVMDFVASRILQVQEFLGRQILIENPSPYLSFTDSSMSEWEFIEGLLKKADCYLLLDVNNLYVNAINNGIEPLIYLDGIPKTRVKEIHLAGYEEKENYLLDTHGYPVHPPVWELYQEALIRFGAVPTLIEWDTDIPSFEVLMAEANKAEKLL